MAALQPGYCCFESNNYKIQTTKIFRLKVIQLLKAKLQPTKKPLFSGFYSAGIAVIWRMSVSTSKLELAFTIFPSCK